MKVDPRGETHRSTGGDGTLYCECGAIFLDNPEFGTAEQRHARHVRFRMGLRS